MFTKYVVSTKFVKRLEKTDFYEMRVSLGKYGSTKGLVASAVGIFFGLIICFGFFFCEMHRVNQSVREIDDLAKD